MMLPGCSIHLVLTVGKVFCELTALESYTGRHEPGQDAALTIRKFTPLENTFAKEASSKKRTNEAIVKIRFLFRT